MSERETAVIKGEGFNSDGGGFAVIHIDGVPHEPDSVRRAVECNKDLLEALEAIKMHMSADAEEYGPGDAAYEAWSKLESAIARAQGKG